VNPWDNGGDPVEALNEAMDVRARLLGQFGENVLKPGQPIGLLQDRFVPVYLYHRFALDRAIKVIGGMEFTYAVKDDGQIPSTLTTPDQQRQSLKLLLDALQPDALLVPPRLLPFLAPRPFGYDSTAQPFDQIATARMLAATILGGLLDRERAARLIAFAEREENPFTFQELLAETIKRTWWAAEPTAKNLARLQRLSQGLVVEFLIELVRDPKTSNEVREIARWQLKELEKAIETKKSGDPLVEAHVQLIIQEIHESLSSLSVQVPPSLPTLPPANLTGSR
jgi:Met-zincin